MSSSDSPRFCMECGQSLPPQAKFCPGCGTKVAVEPEPQAEAKPKRGRRKTAAEKAPAEPVTEEAAPAAEERPKRSRRKKVEPETAPPAEAEPPAAANDVAAEAAAEAPPAGSPRRGWWQRTFGN